MRKIIVRAQVSIDGVMRAPGGPAEDPISGFKYGGWAMPYFDQTPPRLSIRKQRKACCKSERLNRKVVGRESAHTIHGVACVPEGEARVMSRPRHYDWSKNEERPCKQGLEFLLRKKLLPH
jgi:hypothetical protein